MKIDGHSTISKLNETTQYITIRQEDWAPGIWAGMEGGGVVVRAEIKSVDLEDRSLMVELQTVEVDGTLILEDGR